MVLLSEILKSLKGNAQTYFNLDERTKTEFQNLYNSLKPRKDFFVTEHVNTAVGATMATNEVSFVKKTRALNILSHASYYPQGIDPNDGVESVKFNIRNDISAISGMGAFAMEKIPTRHKIGELTGEIITIKESYKRVKAQKKSAIAMVELSENEALDASVNRNQLSYVNHSCDPNTYMRIIGAHVEFYALKPIRKGQELTVDYGLTHHNGKKKCTCGSKNCKGKI